MGQHGEYRYPDGSTYNGDWNTQGLRHGYGHLTLTDGSNYYGNFENGLYHGLGATVFKDGSR